MQSTYITTKIKIKEYLREFLISLYKGDPVRFPNDSDLLATLHDVRVKRPKNAPRSDDNNMEIIIPYQKVGKNARTHNWISARGEKEIEKKAHTLFTCTLNDYVNRMRLKGYEYQAAVEMFADLHNITAISLDGLKKKNYRLRVNNRFGRVKKIKKNPEY